MKFYHRHLPHYHPSGAIFFITFRLANSLPAETVAVMRSEYELIKKWYPQNTLDRDIEIKKYFFKFDQLLDSTHSGNLFLKDERIASILKEAIHYRDGKDYRLFAYCIMPNHVHLVIQLLAESPPLVTILHSLKRNTALMANKLMNNVGPFWQHESYDHVVRDQDECTRIIRYVLDNPVKAGLVARAEEWRWSCYREGIL